MHSAPLKDWQQDSIEARSFVPTQSSPPWNPPYSGDSSNMGPPIQPKSRRPSIRTEDFIEEAHRIMAAIRGNNDTPLHEGTSADSGDSGIPGPPIQPQSPSRPVSNEDADRIMGANRVKNDAPFQEGTVADSGYVSACVSRTIKEPKSCEEPTKDETIERPETQGGPAVDQQTVYTSSVLPHGSDYVSDLCNDIHMKLKDELQNLTHDRGRTEISRYLPDLIKAFSIRIGLESSEPSRAYIMHFLHTNYRYV